MDKSVTATLKVKVVPGASNTKIMGWLGDALKIRVAAPPEKGQANQAVIQQLAQLLDLTCDQIELVAGQTSPLKIFRIHGLVQNEMLLRLQCRQFEKQSYDARLSQHRYPFENKD